MCENMKASGIAWIGDIPESWSIQPMKYKVTFHNGDRGDNYPSKSEMYSDGIPFINAGHITDKGLDIENMDYINDDKYNHMGGVKLKVNDILYCLRGSVGKNAIISIDKGTVASSLVSIRAYNINPKFLFYCLNSDVEETQRKLYDNGTAQPNLSADNLGKYKITIPKLTEQTLIADLLDEKCKKIDSIATDIEKQIEILQKYKKSLITEAVTKGLDQSVTMKASGIEWIGDIPEQWEVKRLKYVSLKIGSGKTPKGGAEIYEDDGITFIRSQNVYDDGLHLDDVKFISDDINNEMSSTQLQTGDILFNITGASIGRCCIYSLSVNGNVNQHVCIIRPNNTCFNAYLRYLMVSEIGKIQTSINQMGGNRDSLTFEQIGNFIIPVAQSNEQIKIANYLDKQCTKIYSIIESKKEQLTKITQHKKSLIYEYVTGKKRVKGANNNGN